MSTQQLDTDPYYNFGDPWWDKIGKRDLRPTNWFLMSTPYPTIYISLGYIVLIWTLLTVMKNRKPFELKGVVMAHNIFLIGLSLYMGLEIARNVYNSRYKFVCNRVDRSEEGTDLVKVLYIFYLSKAYEMVDTILMCLRKKTAQVSFLHVYHHFMTFLLWWIGIYFSPGGDVYLSAMINCFVHVVMYSYYFFASLGYRVWFKKYITQFQIAQFCLNAVHCTLAIALGCGSDDSPLWMYAANVVYMISFIVLFGMFYINSYNKNNKPNAVKSKKSK
mmetsp:Transcript_20827/g.35513  ORF Transcript_20827/g.35513 Transcript_20827/m.35513 type:complete len:275 (+) Transcript_20827:21-845(+)